MGLQKFTTGPTLLIALIVAIVFGGLGFYLADNQVSEEVQTSDSSFSNSSTNTSTVGQGSLSDLATFRDASLDTKSDTITQETHSELITIFKDVFGQARLVEDAEQQNQIVQSNSLLIYAVARTITKDDLTKIATELGKIQYKSVELTTNAILAQKGVQYITHLSINADVNDEGRFIIRVLVY